MSGYFCTSTVTTPMAFLLLPNITTTDIYTTLSDMWIEHGQITVGWQEADLKDFPKEIITNYESIMGITLATATDESSSSTTTTHSGSGRTLNTVAASTSTIAAPTLTVIPIDTLEPTSGPIKTFAITSTHMPSSSVPSSGDSVRPWRILCLFFVCLVWLWTI
ncbi:hypothetical protein F4813DRAFT_394644 [Daldinia decipiens]|uniref:uncharacterized protein n=1 Tax=Daldinia decipiens TaxID=326647 RepID=UPI0020C288F4|nr:uncharacterized protein F4813DRAFT_394644 [Daldinia decipiens]KAI1652479.1 hypothetical protein F4813DRAFT_394644 [Daldinia decipiens]